MAQQSSSGDDDSPGIEIVEVYGVQGVPYKATSSADARRTLDLADTPQTLTILTQSQIRDSGRTDLKEILAAQAGITLGTGENGNAFGDRYVIRGHEARSDVFVDGVRDPGMTTRESFATEQIEITKGPSSTFAGRGSTGGAVNGITKQASTDYDFTLLDSGFGSGSYYRFTLDSNQPIGDTAAVRVNLLSAEEDVPNRGPASRERDGALVSALFSPSDRLDLITDFYYLKADDLPDLGSYFDRDVRTPVEDIPVYLQTNSDFLNTEVQTLTFKVDYDISDQFRVLNTTRYGVTDNGYVTTGARGGTRDLTDPVAPGAPTITLSGHQGWQEVDYFVNQTNLFWNTADDRHQFVFGTEFVREEVLNGTFTLENTGATNCILPGRPPRGAPPGTVAPPAPGHCATDGAGNPVSNINTLLGRTATRGDFDSDYNIDTMSVFAMDTVSFSDSWLGFFGIRYDRYDYLNNVVGRGATTPTAYDYSDDFWNGHAGIVRSIGDNGNVYLTFSTSTNINGGESDVGGSCGYGGLCGTPDQVNVSDPEHTQNIELGTKWDVFDSRLLATAAVFQITKDDVMESVGDSYSTIGTLNTGKNRVQGVEFSLSGNVTENLSVLFNAAFMESKVLEAFNPDNIGLALSNFADDSAYLQLRYEATPRFYFGGSITYQSEMYGGQPDTAAGFDAANNQYSIVVPSYEVVDLFVNYSPNSRMELRLVVGNVTDEPYWTAAYRSGSFMYIGDARNYRASFSWEF